MKTIKYFFSYVCCLIFPLLFYNCESEIDPGVIAVEPEVYAQGTEDGPKVEESIGTAGGSVISKDGKFTLSIPAGAVQFETVFSIQAITNTLPIGSGSAYRLLPKNIKFNKAVTLTYHISETDFEGTTAETFYLGFHDEKGFWNIIKGSSVSENTIIAETEELYDYACLPVVRVKIDKSTLNPGESTNLQIYNVRDTDPGNDMAPVSIKKVTSENISATWVNTSGAGTLTAGTTLAQYFAPESPTAINHVVIETILSNISANDPFLGNRNHNGKLILKSNILIRGEQYMEGTYGGAPFYFPYVAIYRLGNHIWVQGTSNSGEKIVLIVHDNSNKPGNYSFGRLTEEGKSEIRCQFTEVVYETNYIECLPPPQNNETKYSEGNIKFNNLPAPGEDMEGTFIATVYDDTGCMLDSKELRGTFKAPKGF